LVEYSFQEENILTKIHAPDGYEDEEFLTDFLKNNGIAIERKLK
jgi:spermidine/putrescine-binding protein